jgi:hypothetical protein
MLTSGRWAIVAMGIFVTTAAIAVAQSRGVGHLVESVRSSDSSSPFGSSADASPAQSAEDFLWAGTLSGGQALEVRGVNGSIRAGASSGSEVEVRTRTRARRSDPSSVRIEVVEHVGGVTVCAVYPTPDRARGNGCEPGERGRMNIRNNDVRVDFDVLLPAGVDFVARTVNGDIEALELGGDVHATTVNGDVDLKTTGFGRAETVNGDIDAILGATDPHGDAVFETVNGSVTLDLAADVNADLNAKWLSGRFESEIPFTLDGRTGRQSASGTLGVGGPELDVRTINGSIRIR